MKRSVFLLSYFLTLEAHALTCAQLMASVDANATQELVKILKAPLTVSAPNFFEALSKIVDIEKTANNLSPPPNEIMLPYLKQKYPGFKPQTGAGVLDGLSKVGGSGYRELAVMPNLHRYFPEFIVYLKSLPTVPVSPWKAWQYFRESRPKKTAYRALSVTSEEHANIIKNGLLAPGYIKAPSFEDLSLIALSEPFDIYVNQHTRGDTSSSLLNSFSSSREVAAVTAGMNRRLKKEESTKKIVVYKVEAPDVDFITFNDRWVPVPLTFMPGASMRFVMDGKKTPITVNEDSELFIPIRVPAENIVSSETITATQFDAELDSGF